MKHFIQGWGHRTKFQTLAVDRVGGWVGYEIARFSARLRIQDRAECGNILQLSVHPFPFGPVSKLYLQIYKTLQLLFLRHLCTTLILVSVPAAKKSKNRYVFHCISYVWLWRRHSKFLHFSNGPDDVGRLQRATFKFFFLLQGTSIGLAVTNHALLSLVDTNLA